MALKKDKFFILKNIFRKEVRVFSVNIKLNVFYILFNLMKKRRKICFQNPIIFLVL